MKQPFCSKSLIWASTFLFHHLWFGFVDNPNPWVFSSSPSLWSSISRKESGSDGFVIARPSGFCGASRRRVERSSCFPSFLALFRVTKGELLPSSLSGFVLVVGRRMRNWRLRRDVHHSRPVGVSAAMSLQRWGFSLSGVSCREALCFD